VAREPRPLLHLARGVDELIRAAADALELGLGRFDGPALTRVREAVRSEVQRWDERATGDPAAARVRDLFAAILDLLEEDPGTR
jgi:hypothetical protein